MNMRFVFWAIAAIWALVFAGSFVVPWMAPPTGDGFTRGLNRVSGFFGWQIAAGVLATGLWLLGNRFARGSAARRVSRVPAAAFGLLVAGIVVTIVVANLRQPAPETAPPGEVTQPAAPLAQ